MFDAAGSTRRSTAATDTAECHVTSDSKPHERTSNAVHGRVTCGGSRGRIQVWVRSERRLIRIPSDSRGSGEPGCVNPVDARADCASERYLYAASTGPTRAGSRGRRVPCFIREAVKHALP